MGKCMIFILAFVSGLYFSSCKTIISSNKNIGLSPSKVIFTFDDGPNQRNNTTENLLDILNKYQVKGVFCLLGENVAENPEIVRRIYNDGHVIVNHGYSDKFTIFMNKNKFKENLLSGERAITEALGVDFYPKLYRPQGGVFTPKQQRIIDEEGYVIVPFSIVVMDLFTTHSGIDRLTKRITKKVNSKDGGVILLHDRRAGTERSARKLEKSPDGVYNRSWIPEAVETIIIALLDEGYVL